MAAVRSLVHSARQPRPEGQMRRSQRKGEGPLPDDPDAEDEGAGPPEAGGKGGDPGACGPEGLRDDPLFVGVMNAVGAEPG